jgi:hypothetical protein
MKHYLELYDVSNRPVFIAAEEISVIIDIGGGNCSIVCMGAQAAIQVKSTHHQVIKMLVDNGLFTLIKQG